MVIIGLLVETLYFINFNFIRYYYRKMRIFQVKKTFISKLHCILDADMYIYYVDIQIIRSKLI